jgi:hypothetical protein
MKVMMTRPAMSSARPNPYVYRRVAARRPSRNAIPSGMAVSASAALCRVSPSSAIDPHGTDAVPRGLHLGVHPLDRFV